MADDLIAENKIHTPLYEAKVRVDYVMAYPEYDDDHQPKGHALMKNGFRVFGLTRKIALKDRAMGRGDAEIVLDGEWWSHEAKNDQERRALLDHELTHLAVLQSGLGTVKTDDLGRPLLSLRKHDVEIGWFSSVALRHGLHSQECLQAQHVMDNAGQLFWPGLFANRPETVSEDHIESAAKVMRTSRA